MLSDVVTRPGTNDAQILHEAAHYFTDRIDYGALDVCVDVGAHIGGWTRYVKTWSPNAVVLAVEPDKANYDLLRLNTRGAEWVMVFEGRVAYQWADVVRLSTPGNTGGRSFVTREFSRENFEALSARFGLEMAEVSPAVFTLEDIIGEIPAVDVLKLDAEGAEFDILLNAPIETLTKCKWLVGEVHHLNGYWPNVAGRLAPFFRVQVVGSGETALFCAERVQS